MGTWPDPVPCSISHLSRRWEPVSEVSGKDAEESARVARSIGAVVKSCFFNARKAILKLEDYRDASYVEGFAIIDMGAAIEHGWIVREGQVVDPTLPIGTRAYYPGLEFQGRDGINEFLATPAGRRCKNTPFFYAFGWGGDDSESFRRARRDAGDLMIALTSRERRDRPEP